MKFDHDSDAKLFFDLYPDNQYYNKSTRALVGWLTDNGRAYGIQFLSGDESPGQSMSRSSTKTLTPFLQKSKHQNIFEVLRCEILDAEEKPESSTIIAG
ncbi:MAG: hypothetical protein Q9161_008287 [Pseudevernia consocians]